MASKTIADGLRTPVGVLNWQIVADPQLVWGAFAVGEDVDAILDTEEAVVEEMTATRAATPPAHTRIVVDSYDDLHESNPCELRAP